MKILFAGTPQFALPSLRLIHENPAFNIAGVLTNPDAHTGRGRKLRMSPVKEYAVEHNIPVLQPEKLRTEAREMAAELEADIMVVVAYGKIFGPRFLELFPKGGINLHPSLLPLYRGPAPIPAALLAGDKLSGISIQEVGLEMDAGDIILQEEFAIRDGDNTLSLSEYSSRRGGEMLVEALSLIEAGRDLRTEQNPDLISYSHLLHKEDGELDWSLPARTLHNTVRAYVPWPLAHTSWEGRGLNILETSPLDSPSADPAPRPGTVIGVDKSHGILIQTGEGLLALTRLQLHTKKAVDWKSFINGNPQFASSVLGG